MIELPLIVDMEVESDAEYEMDIDTLIVEGNKEEYQPSDVNFYDYDGTLIRSYSKEDWMSVGNLPKNPTHEGLTAQGWNWTKEQIDEQLTAYPNLPIPVGQMYTTDNGETRLYVRFNDGRTSPYLGLVLDGEAEVDWGDGSDIETLAGEVGSITRVQHIYQSGDYIIRILPKSGYISINGANSGTYLLNTDSSNSLYAQKVYTNTIKRIELGENVRVSTRAFSGCYSLESITMPNSITSIGNYAFVDCRSLPFITVPFGVTSTGTSFVAGCYSLKSLSLPSSITEIANSSFSSCHKLQELLISKNVTSIGTRAFESCYSINSIVFPNGITDLSNYVVMGCNSLTSLIIPEGVTTIGLNAVYNCYSLASVTIPSSVTSIGSYAFDGNYGMSEIHLLPTNPPTLQSYAFRNLPSDCVIYVPSESLETYKSATNWSSLASQMIGE